MSAENVDVVRRTYAEWPLGNMKAGVEFFDPEVVFESFVPDARERVVVKGLDAVEAFMREVLAQWRNYRLFGEEFREVGSDQVFVSGYHTAQGRLSGVPTSEPKCSAWTFRDGKVIWLVFDRDRQKALEAVGLRE